MTKVVKPVHYKKASQYFRPYNVHRTRHVEAEKAHPFIIKVN